MGEGERANPKRFFVGSWPSGVTYSMKGCGARTIVAPGTAFMTNMKDHQFAIQTQAPGPRSASKTGTPPLASQTQSEAIPSATGSDEWVVRVEVRFCAAALQFWNSKRAAAFLSAFVTVRPPQKG